MQSLSFASNPKNDPYSLYSWSRNLLGIDCMPLPRKSLSGSLAFKFMSPCYPLPCWRYQPQHKLSYKSSSMFIWSITFSHEEMVNCVNSILWGTHAIYSMKRVTFSHIWILQHLSGKVICGIFFDLSIAFFTCQKFEDLVKS